MAIPLRSRCGMRSRFNIMMNPALKANIMKITALD